MRALWDRLGPFWQRALVVALAVLVIGSVVLLGFGGDPRQRQTAAEDRMRAIITNRDTRPVTLESLAAQFSRVEQTLRTDDADRAKLAQDLAAAYARDVEQGKRAQEVEAQMQRLDTALKQIGVGVEQLGRKTDDLEKRPPPAADTGSRAGSQSTTASSLGIPATADPDRGLPFDRRDPDELFKVAALSPVVRQPGQGFLPTVTPAPTAYVQPTGSAARAPNAPASRGLTTIAAAVPAAATAPGQVRQFQGFYLPAGAVLTGHLVTGVDAPTGELAQQDPFPVLGRLDDLSILPNRYRADMRECFILMSTRGDLSTERVSMRGEKLSCIDREGGVTEMKLRGYAAGEDGKAGMRGRIVTKDGQVIAKALLAGVAEGVANAFNTSDNTVSVDATGQIVGGPAALTSGALSGSSSAFGKIADYYIRLADKTFPVIEVAAARAFDFVVTTGDDVPYKEADVQ